MTESLTIGLMAGSNAEDELSGPDYQRQPLVRFRAFYDGLYPDAVSFTNDEAITFALPPFSAVTHFGIFAGDRLIRVVSFNITNWPGLTATLRPGHLTFVLYPESKEMVCLP